MTRARWLRYGWFKLHGRGPFHWCSVYDDGKVELTCNGVRYPMAFMFEERPVGQAEPLCKRQTCQASLGLAS